MSQSILYNKLFAIVKEKVECSDSAKVSNMISNAEINSGLTEEELRKHHDIIYMLIYAHYTLNNKGTSLLDMPKGCKLLENKNKNNKNSDKLPPILVNASLLDYTLIKILNEYIINPNAYSSYLPKKSESDITDHPNNTNELNNTNTEEKLEHLDISV